MQRVGGCDLAGAEDVLGFVGEVGEGAVRWGKGWGVQVLVKNCAVEHVGSGIALVGVHDGLDAPAEVGLVGHVYGQVRVEGFDGPVWQALHQAGEPRESSGEVDTL